MINLIHNILERGLFMKIEDGANSYYEYGLPKWLEDSRDEYLKSKGSNIEDCLYCEFQSDINVAEIEQIITSEQAWYLRGKYLGLERG